MAYFQAKVDDQGDLRKQDGGYAEEKFLINKLKDYCGAQHWGYENTPVPELLIAQLGYDSGIIGAASLYL